MNTTLPQDSQLRKEYPLYRGLWCYFPAALAGVARHSKIGNDKHNPGEEMHHARGKSTDHEDCILRHLMDLADMLARGQHAQDCKPILDEVNALAWRALALSQKLHEQIGGAPLAPGARVESAPTAEQFEAAVYAINAQEVPQPQPQPQPRPHLSDKWIDGFGFEGKVCDDPGCWC